MERDCPRVLMIQILQKTHGPFESNLLVNRELRPFPQMGEVRVQLRCAPILAMDLLTLAGLYPLAPPFPRTPGAEGVGVVDAVGPGSEALLGRRVLLPIRSGSWREQVVLPTSSVWPVESAASDEDLCTLRVNGLSAAAMIEDLPRGEWLLQSAGSGGVGRAVVHWAKKKGLRVLSVVRSESRAQTIRDLGSDWVLVDGPDLPQRVREVVKEPISLALDGIGGELCARLGDCLDRGGRLLHYGAMSREAPRLSVSAAVFRGVTLEGFWLKRWTDRCADLGEALNALAKDPPPLEIAARFGLHQIHEALALAKSPDRRGRVLLVPGILSE